MASVAPLPIVRIAFYAFIFTLPIESLDVGLESSALSLSAVAGYLFLATALLQPAVTFGLPPRPLWYFAAYLSVFVFMGIWQLLGVAGGLVGRLSTTIQMVVFFWICYSLFLHQQLIKGAWGALGAGCVLLAVLQLSGIAATTVAGGRVSALDQDANSLGSMLSLGLISLLGLAYGRALPDGKIDWVAWIGFGIIAIGVVLSGSRGAFLALLTGLLCFAAKPGQVTFRIKAGVFSLLAIAVLVLAAYQNDAVRDRWERTFSEGHMSGREKIMPEAWSMFLESPLVGWGPGNHVIELGLRFGRNRLDTHNGYLWVLTESGIVGAIPYFLGLVLCLRSAWRARHGLEGTLPFALLMCVFMVNMSITWHSRKIFWLILAYGAASESFLAKRLYQDYSVGVVQKAHHPIKDGQHRS